MRPCLDIDLLRSFVVIADAKALSRAAQRVGRTQAALSQQIKRLEQTLNQPLLQRTGRGVLLTAHGEQLLVHAQRILRCHDEAIAELSGQGFAGTLRFGCPDDYAAVFLPVLLRGFAHLHPQASVEVSCAPTSRLREQLARHAIDLALVSVPAGEHRAAVIRYEQLVWVGCPGTAVLESASLPLALSHADNLDHAWARQALLDCGRAHHIAYASSSLAGLIALARSGQAIAVMTRTAVPGDLQILPTSAALPALPSFGITLEFARERHSPLADAFARHIHTQLPGI